MRWNSWPLSGPLNTDTHCRQTEREGETELCRTRVYERHRTWRDGSEIKNEIGSE